MQRKRIIRIFQDASFPPSHTVAKTPFQILGNFMEGVLIFLKLAHLLQHIRIATRHTNVRSD